MDLSAFFNGLAGAWALSSVAALPVAITLYNKYPRYTYEEKVAGTLFFWVIILLAPFAFGTMLARLVYES
jgi:hypothetical protein